MKFIGIQLSACTKINLRRQPEAYHIIEPRPAARAQ